MLFFNGEEVRGQERQESLKYKNKPNRRLRHLAIHMGIHQAKI